MYSTLSSTYLLYHPISYYIHFFRGIICTWVHPCWPWWRGLIHCRPPPQVQALAICMNIAHNGTVCSIFFQLSLVYRTVLKGTQEWQFFWPKIFSFLCTWNMKLFTIDFVMIEGHCAKYVSMSACSEYFVYMHSVVFCSLLCNALFSFTSLPSV